MCHLDRKMLISCSRVILFLRSLIFNIIFFLSLSFVFFFINVILLFKPQNAFKYCAFASKVVHFLSKYIAGIDFELINRQYLLEENCIFVMRHESTWETLALFHIFKNPVFVVKKQLLNVPLFGRLLKLTGAIAINKLQNVKSLVHLNQAVKKKLQSNHQIVIFPEGTRVAHGNFMELKKGVMFVYRSTGAKIVPVFLDSGFYWPRRGFTKRPGKIKLKFFEPIEPNLEPEDVMQKLNNIFYENSVKMCLYPKAKKA